MKDDVKQYVTTSWVARELGLSIGTVQNLVSTGKLPAIRTQGGHRRILRSSVHEYRTARGYTSSAHLEIFPARGKMIGIMHKPDDVQFLSQEAWDDKLIRWLQHPLDLMGMEEDLRTLFIDARNTWLQTTSISLLEKLHKKFSVHFYNATVLNSDSPWRSLTGLNLIPKSISMNFLEGYNVGLQERKWPLTKEHE